jgi:glutathione synthase/RimK-type ligase-like ATP-grasp enzyme
MTSVLLATCSSWPTGEPGAPALDAALAARGVTARWVGWDDPDVDWAAADLVAVRSTWDYTEHAEEFVAWARRVEDVTSLLNGADVFDWNHDKAYLADLAAVPVVPTRTADTVEELSAAVASFGTSVVKPRVGAGGAGVLVVDDPADPRLGTVVRSHPGLPAVGGPWIVQPLVASVRTEGEISVFVLDGVPVSQVDKLPAGDEIRVHEHFGGVSRPVPLREECADLALLALAAVPRDGRPLDYGRVDMMRLADGALAVSELELIEPGLYLDVVPSNAEPFADLVASRAEPALT